MSNLLLCSVRGMGPIASHPPSDAYRQVFEVPFSHSCSFVPSDAREVTSLEHAVIQNHLLPIHPVWLEAWSQSQQHVRITSRSFEGILTPGPNLGPMKSESLKTWPGTHSVWKAQEGRKSGGNPLRWGSGTLAGCWSCSVSISCHIRETSFCLGRVWGVEASCCACPPCPFTHWNTYISNSNDSH